MPQTMTKVPNAKTLDTLPRGSTVVPFGYDLFSAYRGSNILPKKELHWRSWVYLGTFFGLFGEGRDQCFPFLLPACLDETS